MDFYVIHNQSIFTFLFGIAISILSNYILHSIYQSIYNITKFTIMIYRIVNYFLYVIIWHRQWNFVYLHKLKATVYTKNLTVIFHIPLSFQKHYRNPFEYLRLIHYIDTTEVEINRIFEHIFHNHT